jgi:hypothetical protein
VINRKENIISHNIENGSQGAVANDKELAKKMWSVKSGTGDMRNVMQIVLMRIKKWRLD